MKFLATLIAVLLLVTNANSQVQYQINEQEDRIFYADTISFNDMSKHDIYSQTKQFINNNEFEEMVIGESYFKVLYEDSSNRINAKVKFITEYNKWFLFFHNSTIFDCEYNLDIRINKTRLTYKAYDFLLTERFASPKAGVNRERPIKYHKKGHIGNKHHILPDISQKIADFKRELVETINAANVH